MAFLVAFVGLGAYAALGALATLVCWISPTYHRLLPFAWRIWAWGTVGFIVVDALWLAALFGVLKHLGLPGDPYRRPIDALGYFLTAIVWAGPAVASMLGMLAGAVWGYHLAKRRLDSLRLAA